MLNISASILKRFNRRQLILLLVNFIFISSNLFFCISYRTGELLVDLSFLANFVLIVVLICKHTKSEDFNPFHSVFLVFNYLFFIISPMIQTSNGFYPNTMGYKSDLVIRTNILILIFNIVYYIVYQVLSKKGKKSNKVGSKERLSFSKNTFFTVLILSLLIFAVFFKNILYGILYKISILDLETYQMLIINKFLFSIPIFLIAFLITQKNEFKKPLYITLFLLSAFLLIFVKNPIMERRNAIGPLYLAILFIMGKKFINKNIYFTFIILAIFVIFFPLAANITNSNYGLLYNIERWKEWKLDISKTFSSLHYDAWSNFMATIEYVDKNDITYGRQLLGVIAFFIPRAIWASKPIGTGILIGNYLMVEHAMWFNNLSNPFISEGYINFGVIGVIIFACILSIASVKVKYLFLYNDINWFVGMYISLYMFYLLRGDLMSSFSYLVGALLGFYYLPMLLDRGIRKIEKLTKDSK